MALAIGGLCSEPAIGEMLSRVERLSSGPPVHASINGDTRDVLAGFGEVELLVESSRRVGNRTQIRARVVGPLAKESGVIVMPTFRHLERKTRLPAVSVPVVRDDGGFYVDVGLELKLKRDQTVSLRARQRPKTLVQTHETARRKIPQGAVLEVDFGLLETGMGRGAARFSIEACAATCEELLSTRVVEGAGGSWHRRQIPLDAYGAQQLSFRLTATPESRGGVPSFPVWGVPSLYAKTRSASGQRNVLLISADTLRADHLGTYGYARDTSPFIDEWLAAGGSVFERCFTTATSTGPSHMSMFTGLEPSVHGVYDFHAGIAANVETLASRFRKHGFATAAFTDGGPLAAHRGFHRGFDRYEENKSHKLGSGAPHLERTLRKGASWIRQNRDKRFFLFLHSFAVHSPYDPPPRYESLFAEDGIDAHRGELPEGFQPVYYDREIRHLDDELRAFFATLEAEGLLDDTLVVFLSDHGEEFGEHGQFRHGQGVHDEVLRVPLILRGQGIPQQRISQMVTLLDLMPTLLELAGFPGEKAGGAKSFARLLTAAPGTAGAEESRPVFSEAWQPRILRQLSPGQVRWVEVPVPVFVARTGDRKIVRYPDEKGHRYVYYDLAADPLEQVNRYDPEDEQAQALVDLVDAYARRVGAASPEDPPEASPGLDPEHLEKLRALGYVE